VERWQARRWLDFLSRAIKDDDQYVAFLRGINVGGDHLIRMNTLQRMFASLGLAEVQTCSQSGNVIFEA